MSSYPRRTAGCTTEFTFCKNRIARSSCSTRCEAFCQKPQNFKRMLQILLVDDHELIRAGLKQVLQAGLGKMIVGEASNASDAMTLVQKQSWNIAITDITLPGRSGLDLL